MSEDETDFLPLASEFPPATREAWRKLAEGVLKGRAFETLQTKTTDGLRLEPLYERAREPAVLPPRADHGPWRVMVRIELPDPAAANAEALHELENGATGLSLEFKEGAGARGFGIAGGRDSLGRVLDGVVLDAGIRIHLQPVLGSSNIGDDFAALVAERGLAPDTVDVAFNYQPLSTIAVRGAGPAPWLEMAPPLAAIVRNLQRQGFRGPFVLADGRPVHDAGGSEAQELAFALAAALAYLRAMEAGGVALDVARTAISFRLAADAEQWLTAAKFRALRKLWTRIEQACGLAPEPAFVSAETAWRMMTRRDPYVNALRTSVAAFGAAVGGADAITVVPFTAALGLPDRSARRLARNTQLILREEGQVARVFDPGFGAGALEDTTAQLCGAAWALLQEIEAAGGLATALERGVIQAQVAAVRDTRANAVAKRKIAITGVSDFPNLHEAPVPVLEPFARAAPTAAPDPVRAAALHPTRLSEPFEALRDAADHVLMQQGKRPAVFLATLGSPADFRSRAAFAKSFFEIGGMEAVALEGASDLAEAFRASGAALACLCSSDAVYATKASQAAQRLRDAGARLVFLAGRPGENEAAWRDAGIGALIYAGSDALAVLRAAHDMLRDGTEDRISRRPEALRASP